MASAVSGKSGVALRLPPHSKSWRTIGPRGMRRASKNQIVVPLRSTRRFYGHGIPRVDLEQLAGKLIVVEGADGSGRSTQIAMLVEWLEGSGHATVQVGLKRSTLV